MTYNEFKKLKTGDLCVVIKTGEIGRVIAVNSMTDDIQLQSKRTGLGITKEWYNYTYLAKI